MPTIDERRWSCWPRPSRPKETLRWPAQPGGLPGQSSRRRLIGRSRSSRTSRLDRSGARVTSIPYAQARALSGDRDADAARPLGAPGRSSSCSCSRRRQPRATRTRASSRSCRPQAGGVVVLDLSASITSDTYSRIQESLQQLVARGGRYGLVAVLERRLRGSPARDAGARRSSRSSATSPFRSRPCRASSRTSRTTRGANSFTQGTEISKGLDLARVDRAREPRRASGRAADQRPRRRPQRLPAAEHDAERVPGRAHGLRVIAPQCGSERSCSFPEPRRQGELDLSRRASRLRRRRAPPPTRAFPTWFVVLTIVVALLLAVAVLGTARLDWDTARLGGRPVRILRVGLGVLLLLVAVRRGAPGSRCALGP